ncbi:MAG: carbohydrate ABC transporter permease [Spirochaetia bacterium]|jgi:raffinose/stachyose/melibiose transport system permease protein
MTGARGFSRILLYAACVAVTILVVVPLYISITGGAKSMGQLLSQPMGLPSPFVFSQYSELLTGKVGTYWRALANSLLVAGGSVLIEIFVCGAAAFALARLRFRLNAALYNYFLLGLLFPLAIAILPLYLQIRGLGLLDRYWGVILPQVAFQIPLQVLLLRGFFKSIPKELEDASQIDGHGPLGFLWYMVVPLSTPILSTSGVLTLVVSWNNFFLPLLVFNSNAKFTLPMGVMDFMGEHMTAWNLMLGYLTLAMVPAVVFFILAQKYIVAGLTGGAVKG